MKILLVRPKNYGSFGVLRFVNVEPLELEYLSSICKEEGAEIEVYDGSIESRRFEDKYHEFPFDAVALSGYINSIDTIEGYAEYIKGKNNDTRVIVGGVVAEVVPELMYSPDIDIVVHSGGFEPFRELLQCSFNGDIYKNIKGICYREKNLWIKSERRIFDIKSLSVPDRTHFYKNCSKFRYLHYKPVAIIKTSYSCPYNCSFCYCKKLNNGSYVFMDMEQVASEIKSTDCDNIWIVDDVFLLSRHRVLEFVEMIKRNGIRKSFIVYSRADFIVDNRDILPALKEIGISMVIVGLEAADNKSLSDFNKCTDEDMNKKCVQYLNENNIECTGLFIAGIDYTKEDFKKLGKWIKESNLKTYTVSVFTPLPGTDSYEKYSDSITTSDYSKYDFLHLNMDPINMGRRAFYYEFLKLHSSYVINLLKEVLGKFGDFFNSR